MPKSTALILLKSTSLDIYQIGLEETESLTFFEDTLMHLELTDRDKFISVLSDFIKHIKPQTSILLLSDEVLFQKKLDISEEDLKLKIEDFFDKIPFEKNKIAKKRIETEKELFLFSTNKELYETVVEVFVTNGWTVDIVAPISIFPSVSENSSLSPEQVDEILSSQDILEKSNFIEGKEFVSEEKELIPEAKSEELEGDQDNKDEGEGEKKSGIGFKEIFLAILILIILGGGGFLAYQFRQSYKQTQTDSQKIIEDSLKEQEVASPTPIPTVARDQLTVNILNGSGVSGQAGSIQEELTGIGFDNITIGNFDEDNTPQTMATFSARISDTDKSAITNLLKGIFAQVITNIATTSAQYDVNIVTGTDLAN